MSDDVIRQFLENRASGALGRSTVRPSALDASRASDAQRSPVAPLAGADKGALPPTQQEELSAIESDYAKRVGKPLRQFGYEFLRREVGEATVTGAVDASYVLNIGDEVVVTFRGKQNKVATYVVDTEGRMLVEDLPPLQVAGRPIGAVKEELEARVSETMLGTEVFLSVGRMNSTSVQVAGEVTAPGVYNLNGLSSVIDALVQARGVAKTGSLRHIDVLRGGKTIKVDLYDLMVGGARSTGLTLRGGDVVRVHPVGPTFAVAEMAARPGIFEMRPGTREISVEQALELAGGALRPRGSILSVKQAGQAGGRFIEVTNATKTMLGSGDVLTVASAAVGNAGAVRVFGHVHAPLSRSVSAVPTVRQLFADPSFVMPNPYLLMLPIRRTDPVTRKQGFTAVNLHDVLNKRTDMALQSEDEVVVLSEGDIRFIRSETVQRLLLTGDTDPSALECIAVQSLKDVIRMSDPLRFANAVQMMSSDVAAPVPVKATVGDAQTAAAKTALSSQKGLLVNPSRTDEGEGDSKGALLAGAGAVVGGREPPKAPGEAAPVSNVCPRIFDRYPELLAYLLEHSSLVTGEVRSPGIYPLAARGGLDGVVEAVGGLTARTDLSQVEIGRTREGGADGDFVRQYVDLSSRNFAAVGVGPGDVVRLPRRFSERDIGFIELKGEFVRPGRYDIRRGERLSEVIARAGGLSQQAYPYGAVFLRESIRAKQREGFERTARELENSLVAMAQPGAKDGGDPAAMIMAGRELIQSLRDAKPVGRMTIEADPAVLMTKPESDLVLESGDAFIVPKRPSEVSVLGAVLNPGSLQFSSGAQVSDYIDWAGGLSQYADNSRAFVVFPDGKAQPVSLSSWNMSRVQIPPGSVVVVPQDPRPFQFWSTVKDMATVVGQLAITGASLAVIAR